MSDNSLDSFIVVCKESGIEMMPSPELQSIIEEAKFNLCDITRHIVTVKDNVAWGGWLAGYTRLPFDNIISEFKGYGYSKMRFIRCFDTRSVIRECIEIFPANKEKEFIENVHKIRHLKAFL